MKIRIKLKKFIMITLLLLIPFTQGCFTLGSLMAAGASYALWKATQ